MTFRIAPPSIEGSEARRATTQNPIEALPRSKHSTPDRAAAHSQDIASWPRTKKRFSLTAILSWGDESGSEGRADGNQRHDPFRAAARLSSLVINEADGMMVIPQGIASDVIAWAERLAAIEETIVASL